MDQQLRALLRKRFKKKSFANKAVDAMFAPVADMAKSVGPKDTSDTLYMNAEEKKSIYSSIGSFISRMADSDKKEFQEGFEFLDHKITQSVSLLDYEVQKKFEGYEKKFDSFEKRLNSLEKKYPGGTRTDYNQSRERFKETRDKLFRTTAVIGSATGRLAATAITNPYVAGGLGLGTLALLGMYSRNKNREQNEKDWKELEKLSPEERNHIMMKRMRKAGFGSSKSDDKEDQSIKTQDFSIVAENTVTLEAKREFRIKAKKIVLSADSIIFDTKDLQMPTQKKLLGPAQPSDNSQKAPQQNTYQPPSNQQNSSSFDSPSRIERGASQGAFKGSYQGKEPQSSGSSISRQQPQKETKEFGTAVPSIDPSKVPDAAKDQKGLDTPGLFPGTSTPAIPNINSSAPQSLEHINPNQLKFIRAIGATESSWSKSEAYSERYNQSSNNRNVRSIGEAGKDYGYFQNNAQQVKEAVEKYGMDPDLAKHLNGGGANGKSTPEQQTAAMHEYLSKRWPQLYDRVKTGDPSAIEDARNAMKGTWFGIADSWNKSSTQAVLAGKTLPGMISEASKIEKGSGTIGTNVGPYINLNKVPSEDIIKKEIGIGTREFHFDPNEEGSKKSLELVKKYGGKAIAYNKGYGDSNYKGESDFELSSGEGLEALNQKSKEHVKDGYSAMQIDNLHKAKSVSELKSIFDSVDPNLKIVPNGNPKLLAQLLRDHPEYRDRMQYALFENASKFGNDDQESAALINKRVRGYNIEFGKGNQAATPEEARGLRDRLGFAGVYHYNHGEGEDGKSGGVSGREGLQYFGTANRASEAVKYNPDTVRSMPGVDVSVNSPTSIGDRFGSLTNRPRNIDGYRKGQDDFNWSMTQEAQKEFGVITANPNLTSLKTQSGKQYSVRSSVAKQTDAFVTALEDRGYKIGDIGGFSYRNKVGGSSLSTHATGTTIDINAGRNAFHSGRTDLPENAEKLAWLYRRSWGGRFNDSMHFEMMSKELHEKRLNQLVKEGFITPEIAKYALENGMPPPGWDKGKSDKLEIPKGLEPHLKALAEKEDSANRTDLQNQYKKESGKSAKLASLFGEKDSEGYQQWLKNYKPDQVAGVRVDDNSQKAAKASDGSPSIMESAKRVDSEVQTADALVPKKEEQRVVEGPKDYSENSFQVAEARTERSTDKVESTKHNPEKEDSSPGSDGSGSGGKADAMEYDP